MSKSSLIDKAAVQRAYARWAPVYDATFGIVADAGRVHAVDHINKRRGNVLEVGVGTGISLPRYGSHLDITGIDLCPEMLAKARARVEKKKLSNVSAILEMDAGNLEFEDDSFNTVVAMYVMTVVPEPEQVLGELERVCAPGGEVVIVNHFSRDHGFMARIEKVMAPFASSLGWRPDFPFERLMGRKNLHLVRRMSLRPFGLFTMLRFRKEISADVTPVLVSESAATVVPSREEIIEVGAGEALN